MTNSSEIDLVATAPGAVRRLRDLIVTLAVQGKLVPQFPENSVRPLLESMRADQSHKQASETGKRHWALNDVSEREIPFTAPAGWKWVRMGMVVDASEAGWSPSCEPNVRSNASEWGVLKVSAVSWGAFDSREHKRLSPSLAPRPEFEVRDGDFLISRANTEELVARSVIANKPEPKLMMSDKIIRLYVNSRVNRHFINLYNNCRFARSYYGAKASGTSSSMKNVPREVILGVPLPLPPAEEQLRIVERVGDLMKLCDSLERSAGLESQQHARLASVLFDSLVASESPKGLAENWQQVAEHFDLLLDRPEIVDKLDECILQLAMDGLLVRQDPDEEPAKEIVKRIARQKQTMIAEGKSRQGKVSRPKDAATAPKDLPKGWEWINVDSICFKVTDGTHFTPNYVDVGIRFVSAKDIVGGVLAFDRCKFISQKEHEQLYKRCNPEYHDIVMSKSGSIGTVALVNDRGQFSLFESLALLKFDQKSLCAEFLILALTHACASLTASHIRGVGVKHLHLDILRGLEMGLPPLFEQERIVQRVLELRRLLGQLRDRLTSAANVQKHLADAVVLSLVIGEHPNTTSHGAC